MIEIKDLLSRYNNTLVSGEFQKVSICEAVFGAIGVKIKTEDVEIKDNIVYLNIKPIYKNEIFIKKQKIQKLLEQMLGKKSPEDLR